LEFDDLAVLFQGYLGALDGSNQLENTTWGRKKKMRAFQLKNLKNTKPKDFWSVWF
jgi:hypothetical protein